MAARLVVSPGRAHSGGVRATLVLTVIIGGACRPAAVTVAAAGDLYLGGTFGGALDVSLLGRADLRFANLEGPIVAGRTASGLDESGRPGGGPVKLAAEPARVDWIAGKLDVVSLENNHALDQGEAGRDETLAHLAKGRIAVAWSGDGKQLLAGTWGQGAYRAVAQREGVKLLGTGYPLQWHPDRKRFLSGGGYFPVQGLDSNRGVRLGTLYPRLGGTHHVCISADGHYRGSDGIEQHLVYIALTKDGHQETYSPTDFATKFGWKNDPTKARLMGTAAPAK